MTRRRAREPEQGLLDGMDADSALARLLADASAPAQPDELDGLSAALTAFSASQLRPRRSPVKTILASLLATKALAVTAAAASIGGVALAAATGSLPPAAQNAAHNLVRAPAGAHSDGTDDVNERTSPATIRATPSAKPSATPSPSLVGLCRAYSAGVATANGKALDNPAFTVLISAAGSKDAVTSYCIGVLDAAPGGKPTALPTQAQNHKPGSHHTGPPSSHPVGRSSSHPTGAPTSHPTGAPTSHPTKP
jgi:hypothetical protein